MDRETPSVFKFFLTGWLAAAVIIAIYGILMLVSGSELLSLGCVAVLALVLARHKGDIEWQVWLFFLSAVLVIISPPVAGKVMGGILFFLALMAGLDYGQYLKKAGVTRWLTLPLLFVMPFLMVPVLHLPVWTLPGLAVVYLMFALIFWMLPIALVMQASLEDDR